MKENIGIILVLISIVSLLSIIFSVFFQKKDAKNISKNSSLWENYEIKNQKVEGKELKLIVADSPARFEKGLMYVRKPVDFDGMIFEFPDKQDRHFWNMNTFEDLDLYWYNDDNLLGKSFLPSIEKSKETVTVSSPGQANIVIEAIR